MKLILKIENVLPLFFLLLITGTVWSKLWAKVATFGGVWAKFAGAALTQWP